MYSQCSQRFRKLTKNFDFSKLLINILNSYFYLNKANNADNNEQANNNMNKLSLLHRYMKLLKTTILAFFLSTCLHIGCVTGYYAAYLWLYPDNEGKKNFYSATTVSQGVNIGGNIIISLIIKLKLL